MHLNCSRALLFTQKQKQDVQEMRRKAEQIITSSYSVFPVWFSAADFNKEAQQKWMNPKYVIASDVQKEILCNL